LFQIPLETGLNVSYKCGITSELLLLSSACRLPYRDKYSISGFGDQGKPYNFEYTFKHYIQSLAKTVLHVGDLSYDMYKYIDMSVC